MPLCDEFVKYCKNFDFKIRRDHQKISYEHRDYESVDEKYLSQTMCRKTKKKNSGSKGLKKGSRKKFPMSAASMNR